MTNPDIPMPPPARTGGDTALPMRDVVRLASDGIHYLAVFDNHSERPIYLGRQTRIATAEIRPPLPIPLLSASSATPATAAVRAPAV